MQLSEMIFESKGYIDYTLWTFYPFPSALLGWGGGGSSCIYIYTISLLPSNFKVILYEVESPVLKQIAQYRRKIYWK